MLSSGVGGRTQKYSYEGMIKIKNKTTHTRTHTRTTFQAGFLDNRDNENAERRCVRELGLANTWLFRLSGHFCIFFEFWAEKMTRPWQNEGIASHILFYFFANYNNCCSRHFRKKAKIGLGDKLTEKSINHMARKFTLHGCMSSYWLLVYATHIIQAVGFPYSMQCTQQIR